MELWPKNAFLNCLQTSNLLLAYEKYPKGNPCLWPHNELFAVLGCVCVWGGLAIFPK